MRNISRDDLVDKLNETSGYYKKDLKAVLHALEDVLEDYLSETTLEEPVQIQLLPGIKICGRLVPERERVDPRNQDPVVCEATIKPGTTYSSVFKNRINEKAKEKKGR